MLITARTLQITSIDLKPYKCFTRALKTIQMFLKLKLINIFSLFRPIGVTMVGIHARTGREKIFSKNVAHVLNDETQRKYIQGLKRLMTKCQEFYPTDPSRSVEYVSKKDRDNE